MSPEFVTERELQAHLEPIQNDITEVKTDVKTLILAHTAAHAAAAAVKEDHKDRGARRMAVLSLIAAALGSLWWVNDAIAKFTH